MTWHQQFIDLNRTLVDADYVRDEATSVCA